jgi:two-component system cell cycle response regulator
MHIVVVDPSRTVRRLLTQQLAAGGYVGHAFDDAGEALACVKSNPEVGAVITSIMLPSMAGLELCWETRLLAARRPMYIIVMAAASERHMRIEALDSGADDFINKPFAAEDLYARLRAAERVGKLQRELIELATFDSLTGVLNRRAFFTRAAEACAAAEAGMGLVAIMLDVDLFKQVNDRHGHDVGDAVLCAVAKTGAEQAEIFGRLGGEEFALLLEGATPEYAMAFAEQLRCRMATLDFIGYDGVFRVTCSFGLAEWQPGDGIDRLLKRADIALYEAKSNGRNRVVMAPLDRRREDAPPSRFVRNQTREIGVPNPKLAQHCGTFGSEFPALD